MAELWDVYDKDRNITGKIVERGTYMADDEYHLVVQIWIKNDENKWLISKRAPHKSQDLKWEPTGGSVVAGETSLQGALREVKEEVGITLEPEKGHLFKSFRREKFTWANPGFLDIWVFENNTLLENIVLQEEETIDAKWATVDEILELMETDEFVPLGENLYHKELFGFDTNF